MSETQGTIKLTVVLGGRTLERYEFKDPSQALRIGRSEECEVQIDNLGISRLHAEIVQEGAFHVLRDLNSNNGTFVNGTKVEVHNLNDGDVVSIGKYSIEFHTDSHVVERPLTAPTDGDQLDGQMTLQVDPVALARMQGGKASRIRGFLTVRDGKEPERTVQLEKPVFVMGKDPSADLVLSGWFCPRVVAVMFRDETGFRLLDVSPRGDMVLLNGRPRRDVRLTDHDEITIRNKTMRFQRGTPGAADPPTHSFRNAPTSKF
jgi:FHA domain